MGGQSWEGLSRYLGDAVSIQRRDDVTSVGQLQRPHTHPHNGNFQVLASLSYSFGYPIQRAGWDSHCIDWERSGFRRIAIVSYLALYRCTGLHLERTVFESQLVLTPLRGSVVLFSPYM